MTVSTIYVDSQGQIFTEGRHLAVTIDKRVFATLHDPAVFTGLSQRQLIDAAERSATVIAPRLKKKIKVTWPKLDDARREWPRARVVMAERHSAVPRATTVHWRTPKGRKSETHYRSMKSVRDDLGLTDGQFEAIANQSPGYQSHLLPTMAGIEVHPRDYRHPDSARVFAGRPEDPLFSIKEVKNGFSITYTGPKTVRKHVDIPRPVLVNSIWEK